MQYEFILKEKISLSSQYEKIGSLIVPFDGFDEELKRYQDYVCKRQKRYPSADYLILINVLDDEGNFIEVYQ